MIRSYLYKKDGSLQTDISREQMKEFVMAESSGEEKGFLWVDLETPTEEESKILNEIFNFHPLAIEDCLIPLDRPKIDDYEKYVFMVLHAATFDVKEGQMDTLEVDIFLSKNYIVTFHLVPVNSVTFVRNRLSKNPDICKQGVDILLHSILDAMVDNYFPFVEQLDDKIENLEEEIFSEPTEEVLTQIFALKKDVFFLRKIVTPQTNIINNLIRGKIRFMDSEIQLYFKDVYDHLTRINDMLDSYRDSITSVLEGYMSVTSNKMNQVMKTLTLIVTIITPLTFITGIYGMNFKNMPELYSSNGYFIVLGIMCVIAISMLVYFKKVKKWF